MDSCLRLVANLTGSPANHLYDNASRPLAQAADTVLIPLLKFLYPPRSRSRSPIPLLTLVFLANPKNKNMTNIPTPQTIAQPP